MAEQQRSINIPNSQHGFESIADKVANCDTVLGSDKLSNLELGTENFEKGCEINGVFDGNTGFSELGVSCMNQSDESELVKRIENSECLEELKDEGVFCKRNDELGVKNSVRVLEESKDIDVGFCKNGNSQFEGFKGGAVKLDENLEEGSQNLGVESVKNNGVFDEVVKKIGKKHEFVGFCKNENFEGGAVELEVVDETAVADDIKIVERKNKKRGRKNKEVISSNVGFGNMYSRKEMEVLRFVNVKGQKKFWKDVYSCLPPTVRKEYDELGMPCISIKNRGRQDACIRSQYANPILGESTSEDVNCHAETIGSINYADNSGLNGDNLVGESSGQEESDDEYESIQRPAFLVEGEPDFDSGPPEDGLEYLRRVRWEAAQMPKVKIAKIDNMKLKEQSVYLPQIPDIEKCPPHLVPLQQWEDYFIANFSELRLAFSCLDETGDTETQSIIFHHKEHTCRTSESLASLELPLGGPTLSTVLDMEPVTRVTLLRRRISLFDNANGFSKDDCAWLFALCAVVDTPLDADTCASLRCLLRRCAKLRAAKSELDDEVIMLNILATISGKFFGQWDL